MTTSRRRTGGIGHIASPPQLQTTSPTQHVRLRCSCGHGSTTQMQVLSRCGCLNSQVYDMRHLTMSHVACSMSRMLHVSYGTCGMLHIIHASHVHMSPILHVAYSHVTCHIFTCRMSHVHMLPVACYLSHVTCRMFTCCMPHVTCLMFTCYTGLPAVIALEPWRLLVKDISPVFNQVSNLSNLSNLSN